MSYMLQIKQHNHIVSRLLVYNHTYGYRHTYTPANFVEAIGNNKEHGYEHSNVAWDKLISHLNTNTHTYKQCKYVNISII